MSTNADFFRRAQITDATLRVRSLKEVGEFYRNVLGLKEIIDGETTSEQSNKLLALSANGQTPALLILEEDPAAPERVPGTPGLFHIAYLYPDRASLADALQRLMDLRYPLQGASDHGVSEAIYLADPEGNGIELYADRPAEKWLREGRDVAMYTEALDMPDLLAQRHGPVSLPYSVPAEMSIGHMHLQVSDLAKAGSVATGELGMKVRQKNYPGALFLAYDNYHHHLGMNAWGVRRAANPESLGLKSFTLRLDAELLPSTHQIEAANLDAVRVDLVINKS